MTSHKPRPKGRCYCGCGHLTRPMAYWAPGHDLKIVDHIIARVHGSRLGMAIDFGFGPDGPRRLSDEVEIR